MDGITITHESYAKKVLKDASMFECNSAQIPMDPNVKFSKGVGEEDVDATKYRNLVGRLRYLLQTRPDLSYSVGVASRYMQEPKKSHMVAVKQILRYIKGTMGYGIRYAKGGSGDLIGYSDSSHNIDEDDGRSTTGHIFFINEAPITWCSQKQETVALSSCEAEYMAASAASCQAVWIRELLAEITKEKVNEVVLRVDNTSAIA